MVSRDTTWDKLTLKFWIKEFLIIVQWSWTMGKLAIRIEVAMDEPSEL